MRTIEQVMSREPVIVHVDQPLVEAAARMGSSNIGALMVVDGDELVGVVTDRDLVIRGIASGREPSAATVIDVMTRHVVYCFPTNSVNDAAELMSSQKIRRLAVVDEDRELVGVVSIGDLARAGAQSSDMAARAMRAICEPTSTAKVPAREDPTGGRRRGSPPGSLQVYARRPSVRRRPVVDP